jgi:glycosyltransferase involved in cell wall biosynthesis/SAM-dependent methyltransferase
MTIDWKNEAETLLKAIWTPELDPLFWRAGRKGVESAWYGHVPFAHWLVRALAPRCIVELGAHNGVSYSAFCEAVQLMGFGTRCFAVDTWTGDDHAGHYGEEVLAGLRAYHDPRFSAFSTLIRQRFDDALEHFAEGSIDLLHIDGRHGYEDVRHDFDSWRGKMSDRGVILFHDTNVRDNEFGVWRLWSELQPDFPHFEFLHGFGLGVLLIGTECPPAVAALSNLRDTLAIGAIRDRFAQLGERCVYEAQVSLLDNLARQRAAERNSARTRLTETGVRLNEAEAALQAAQTSLESLRVARAHAAQADQAAAAADVARRAEARARAAAEAALNQILLSSTWRATRPLRTLLSLMPPNLRRRARLTLQTVWRGLTPQLNQARRAALPLPPAPAPVPAPLAYLAPPATASATGGPLICYISGEPETPGTIYRVQRYAAACSAAGARVTILTLDELTGRQADAAGIDILVIWRAAWNDALAAFIETARAHGARIVFDVDDLMIDPALAKTEIIDGIRSQRVSETAVQALYALMQRTMFTADYCTSSTQELTGHMRRFGKTGFVLPNGFDAETVRVSRMAVRRRQAAAPDGLLRIGYASGSRTHQRDFAEVAPALPAILTRFPQCRLVLFQASDGEKLIDLHEFPELEPFAGQIEWRNLVKLDRLPEEIARFDVNLAPLQCNNLFCEAKSELKYFEAALVDVPTIASPVGAYGRAIRDGATGFLAATPAQWEQALERLLNDPALRRQITQTARNEVLWTYGPERRTQLMRRSIAEWQGGSAAADAFVLEHSTNPSQRLPGPFIPPGEVVWSADHLRPSEVTVIVTLYNYAHTVIETLDSVRAQTLRDLDLVIVDDQSADQSLQTVLDWARLHASRFNRLVVMRNHANAGLGFSRNAAFSAAETPYILPLDADNLLRPACCEQLLAAITASGAAFAYPVIQEFGGRTGLIGAAPYHPSRLAGGNYIDAMALIAKSTWSAAGGYAEMRSGWEDYDFWCAVAEAGLHGYAMGGEPLADYRVHDHSMLAKVTDTPDVKHGVIAAIERRHPWVTVARPLELDASKPPSAAAGPRLQKLLPILRCPETHQALTMDGPVLRTADGSRSWPVKDGRPILFPGMAPDSVASFSHFSNEVPESALKLIRSAKGLVLNLSAGGTQHRFEHVIEAEAAIFGHTDLVADSHALPFADSSFEAVIAMNAFEHYHDPVRAAAEIYRVLQPGGFVLIRTAFLQPQHEAPYHFYNATKSGVAEWFAAFDTEQLHVSDNFNPSYALAWMAHECQSALQKDAGAAAAERFAAEPIGRFAKFWTDPASRGHEAWTVFAQLSQPSQEAIAAGFEYLGRRPL